MAFSHINAVKKESKATGTTRTVILVLATYADKAGHCYVTRAELAGDCAIDERSLTRHLNALETLGELTISRGNGRGNRTDYVVNLGNEKGDKSGQERVTNPAETLTDLPPFTPERVTDLPPFSGQERVTNPAERVTKNDERVTNRALKGDKSCSAYKEVKSQKSHVESHVESQGDAGERERTQADELTPSLSPLATALCQLCRLEVETLSPAKYAELRAAEVALHKVGRTPEQVATFGEQWFAHDWRGKRGDPPTLNQVRDDWGKVLALKPRNQSDALSKPASGGESVEQWQARTNAMGAEAAKILGFTE